MLLALLQRHEGTTGDVAAGWTLPLHLLRHRSPGCVIFAADSVSIHQVQLSDDDDRSRIVVAFDGRIDNRQELLDGDTPRRAGAPSDSALICALYLKYGQECAAKVVGDFRFIVYDERARTLTGCVDIACTRRLWWRDVGTATVVTSNLGDLYADAEALRLDYDYFAEFLTFSWILGRNGPLSGSSRLLAAETLHVAPRATRVRKYWCPSMFSAPASTTRPQELVAEFADLFRLAVQRRIPPAGALLCDLSGGLDSTSITAMAGRILGAETADRLHAVTVAYPDAPKSDERERAARIADTVGANHHILERRTSDPFFGGMPEDACYWDEPKCNVHAHITALDKQRILRSLKSNVLLSGAGAEALLCEQMIWPVFLADSFIRGRWGEVAEGLRNWHAPRRAPLPLLLYRSCLAPIVNPVNAMTTEARLMAFRPWLTNDARRRARERAEAGPRPVVKRLNSAGAWMAEQWIGAGMVAEYGVAAHAYETRFPFLDRTLVEGVLKMPWSVRAHRERNKFLLRQLARDLLPAGFATQSSRGADQAVGRALGTQFDSVKQRLLPSVLAELGLVDEASMAHSLAMAARGLGGGGRPTVTVVGAELWARSVASGEWRRKQLTHVRRMQSASS